MLNVRILITFLYHFDKKEHLILLVRLPKVKIKSCAESCCRREAFPFKSFGLA